MRNSNSNSNRFMLLAVPQRQDSQSSVYSNDDYGVTGRFNYLTGSSRVVIWEQKGFRAVRNVNC